jgi:hypothetical protein
MRAYEIGQIPRSEAQDRKLKEIGSIVKNE